MLSINLVRVEQVEFTPDSVHDGSYELNAAQYPDIHHGKPPKPTLGSAEGARGIAQALRG